MNHFYSHLHATEEGREATLKFLELEDECDTHNMQMLQSMDISHTTKGKLDKAKKSFDLNTRDRKSLRAAFFCKFQRSKLCVGDLNNDKR